MTAPINLDTLVSSLIKSSPPGELNDVNEGLSSILTSETSSITLRRATEKYVNENAGVVSGKYIASKYNKSDDSTKYIDFIGKKKFNIDLKNQTAIDFEAFEPITTYPEYFDELISKLESYGDTQFPSLFAFTVIPGEDEIRIMIIGQRKNNANFYTGEWKSMYTLKDGNIKGEIKLDIHYFEDGNVRLTFEEPINGKCIYNASDIVNFISNIEDETALKLVANFNDLNQTSFKNLRRLLPVTRSKINWGSAIGNYKLGSDILENK